MSESDKQAGKKRKCLDGMPLDLEGTGNRLTLTSSELGKCLRCRGKCILCHLPVKPDTAVVDILSEKRKGSSAMSCQKCNGECFFCTLGSFGCNAQHVKTVKETFDASCQRMRLHSTEDSVGIRSYFGLVEDLRSASALPNQVQCQPPEKFSLPESLTNVCK